MDFPIRFVLESKNKIIRQLCYRLDTIYIFHINTDKSLK